jgi:phenylpropionate dioxygenase-like ring-hydroxylating dioxygenase large terminal subunit
MGDLFRRFWLPALLSSELPSGDGPPVRVRLLGERLIAFRDSSNRVGILEERCPHRHASLYWARNEDGGLRCVYHGWKFTADGSCVDQPAEPAGSHFKDHVRAVAYETHETGGIVWIYMGPRDRKPPFPHFEWTSLSPDRYGVSKRLQMCNYLQNLEGEVDTAHVNFLHRRWRPGDTVMPSPDVARKRYFLKETEFGLLCMARSEVPEDRYYWRITPFHLPTFTIAPVGVNSWLAAVPADDTTMWGFSVRWNPDRPIEDDDTAGSGVVLEIDPKTFIPRANITNDYLRDLELQRTASWTGMKAIKEQDMAAQEDQDGPLMRRDEEHLGVTDGAIVAVRRLLLRLAEELTLGNEPEQAWRPEAYCLRSLAVTASREADPEELWRRAQPSVGLAGKAGRH